MTSSVTSQHALRVRMLYKHLLRLHRALPPDIRQIGDVYVHDEFKRHRDEKNERIVEKFLNEWTDYSKTLAQQVSPRALVSSGGRGDREIGKNLNDADLESMSDQQIVQLYQLQQEARKPKTTISNDHNHKKSIIDDKNR